jgi:hypothetical protein
VLPNGRALDLRDGGLAAARRPVRYELWQKVKFGQPGAKPPMGPQGINTVEEMQDLYKAMSDPERYPDPAG